MLNLLWPARSRVIQGLANFWCSICVEVKKDLKPKHFGPEGPVFRILRVPRYPCDGEGLIPPELRLL